MSSGDENIPTSAITFLQSEHGRLRRAQRGIVKRDLQAAKKYGVKKRGRPRRNGDRVAKYIYKDIVYIVNEVTGQEITSYTTPIELKYVTIYQKMLRDHYEASRIIRDDFSMWKSNTVIVIDTSGSMRKCDVQGAKTRLDAVWLSLALDFISLRIESGNVGLYDVVSIVSLGEDATIILEDCPTSWVLYNKVVEFYKNKSISARGHGDYIPTLEKIEKILTRNPNTSCAVGLCFLSDGRPSDAQKYWGVSNELVAEMIIDKVEILAKQFGRRMRFDAIGIGSADQFDTLQDMVDKAKEFGVQSSLLLPSASSKSLGDALSSFASSMTTTQTEMTCLNTSKQLHVRNVSRESRINANLRINRVSEDDFYIYKGNNVKRYLYKEEKNENDKRVQTYEEVGLIHPEARNVAFCKEVFGEGAERFAYRLYEIGACGKVIVGKPLVAKESRFVIEHGIDNEENRKKFVETFCRTQQLASRIAHEFNENLDKLWGVHDKTPRVEFLDCSIYDFNDENLGWLRVLVEEKLDHEKWFKWNSNNGYVAGKARGLKLCENEIEVAMEKLKSVDLEMCQIIEEEEEEEEDDDEEVAVNIETTNNGQEISFIINEREEPVIFSPFDVAQAFSHFSYLATGKKRLICDLQGVFDEKANILKLTDPVIHYRSDVSKRGRKNVHGRTDRGSKGVALFFETHECNSLCNLTTRGFKNAYRKRPSKRQKLVH